MNERQREDEAGYQRVIDAGDTGYNARISRLEENYKRLAEMMHQHVLTTAHMPRDAVIVKTPPLYAPLRNDTKAVLDLAAFARRLLEFDDLGQQCSALVRDAAREALGMKKVET